MNRFFVFVVLFCLMVVSPVVFSANSAQDLFQQRVGQIQWKNLSIEFRSISDKASRGAQAMVVQSPDQENGKTYYADKKVILGLKDISNIDTTYNPNDQSMLRLILTFNKDGKATLAEHTTKHLGEMMGVVIDGKLRLVAHIRQPLMNGRVQVYGFIPNEAVNVLQRYYQPRLELARQIGEELNGKK